MKISNGLIINLKRIFRDKKNIYFMSVLIFFSMILLLILNFKENFSFYIKSTITENIGFRTLSIIPQDLKDATDIEKLNSIEHIDYIYSSKYGYTPVISSYESESYDGWLQLMIGNEFTIPKNIKGSTINANDTGVAICPNDFLPSSESENLIVNNSLMIKGNDILNSTFDIFYESYRFENGKMIEDKSYQKTFKIVGLYDSSEVANYNNTCYISERDIKDINEAAATINPENNITYSYYIIVDNLSNVEIVVEKLEELGYSRIDTNNQIDISLVNNIEKICNIITIIVLFALVMITILYTKKKQINDVSNLGLLRSVGYKKRTILHYYFFEIMMMSIISFIIGLFIFSLLYIVSYSLIIKPFINMIFQIKLFYLTFLITLGIVIFIPILFKMFYLVGNINRNIVDLIGEMKL